MFLNFVLKKGNSYYLNTVLCYFLGAGAGKSKKDRLRQLFKVHEESPCKVNATGTGISTRILAEVASLPRLWIWYTVVLNIGSQRTSDVHNLK